MSFFKQIFKEKDNKVNENVEVIVEKRVDENSETETYNYGLDLLDFALHSKDYRLSSPRQHKKVVLVNPQECKNKINLGYMAALWRGTGHTEWEFLLSGWFVESVVDAIKIKSEEADITKLFKYDLYASENRIFKQEDVCNHILPWFEVVSETEDKLKLKFKIV